MGWPGGELKVGIKDVKIFENCLKCVAGTTTTHYPTMARKNITKTTTPQTI